MPEGEEIDPETAAQLAAAAASGQGIQVMTTEGLEGDADNGGDGTAGARVFTLAVGKQGALQGVTSEGLQIGQKVNVPMTSIVDQGPPMPEPLTQE